MRRHTGLTLIEMSCTLAIVGMLTAACLRVVVSLSRSAALMESRHGAATLEAGLAKLLAADVLHAERYMALKDGQQLALQTRARLERETLKLRHLPCQVTYEVRQVAGRNYLLRRQQMPNQRDWIELVCRDAARIELICLGEKRLARESWRAMPKTATVKMHFDDETQVELEFHYRLR